jgi:hypothetical protein
VAVAVVLGVVIFGLIPGQIAARIVLVTPAGVPRFTELQPVIQPIVMNVSMFSMMLLGIWIWVRFVVGRPFRGLGWEREDVVRHVARGMALAMVMAAAACGLSIVQGFSSSSGLVQRFGSAAFGIRFISLLSYCVQGPAEETLFRGWLMRALSARYRPWVGVIGSAVVFSLAHSLNGGIGLLGYLSLFLFGSCAALLALREGGLWEAGAWHGVWNWMMGDVLGFTLDGLPHVGLFRAIHGTGSDFITGGAFGPDGGIGCIAVLLAAIAVLCARLAFRRDRPANFSHAGFV